MTAVTVDKKLRDWTAVSTKGIEEFLNDLFPENIATALRDVGAGMFYNNESTNPFQKLVVNCILAADIVDKEIQNFGKARWDRTFNDGSFSRRQSPRKGQPTSHHRY